MQHLYDRYISVPKSFLKWIGCESFVKLDRKNKLSLFKDFRDMISQACALVTKVMLDSDFLAYICQFLPSIIKLLCYLEEL